MIIGQKKLIDNINKIKDNFPRFSIIIGDEGCGKKLICKYICNLLNMPMIECGLKIDDVREIIKISYEQEKKICYVFTDSDDMSLGAKNSLLKVTEEPPKNSYFILTLKNKDNMLPTILSRAFVLKLDDYTTEELIEYRKFKKYNESNDNILKNLCSTTGEVDKLFKNDIPGFYNFANLIVENIDKVDEGNIFNISNKLINSKPKDSTAVGYDAILMFKLLRKMFFKKGMETKDKKYLQASNVTSRYIYDLSYPILNKIATLDMWIMDVRKVLR